MISMIILFFVKLRGKIFDFSQHFPPSSFPLPTILPKTLVAENCQNLHTIFVHRIKWKFLENRSRIPLIPLIRAQLEQKNDERMAGRGREETFSSKILETEWREEGGGEGITWNGSLKRVETPRKDPPPPPRQHCNGRFFNKRQLAKEAWKEVVEGETESGEFPARLEARRWETDVARYTRFQGSRWLPRKPREILHLTSHRGCDSLTLLPRQLRAPWNGD